MTDILTPKARSERMSKVRQKNTKPELVLRKALHAAGLRYVLHPPDLPGRPDIVFPKYVTAIFVHGCFWHGHECRAGRAPSSNSDYWIPKIAANRTRDSRKAAELRARGWNVIQVWECETKSSRLFLLVEELAKKIRAAERSKNHC
jgi:DNA mismatch endonuclease (patch repair protein)